MNSTEMRRRAAQAVKEAEALNVLAEKEDRLLTAEEDQKFTSLLAEADQLREDATKLDERNASLSARIEDGKKSTLGGRPPITGRPAWEGDKKRGFKNHTEFFVAVMNAGLRRSLDERLNGLMAKNSGINEQFTAGSDEQGIYADPYGGFLIPEGMIPGLLQVEPEGDPFNVNRFPMNVPTVKFNARVDKDHSSSVSGGFRVYWRAETQDATASRQAYEQVVVDAHGLFGLTYATEELINYSPMSIAALINAGFGDEFMAKIIDARINGTGVGQLQGILNSDCLVTVSKESGQAADTIVYDNLVKMRARCWGYSSAIWYANDDCYPQMSKLSLVVGTGGSAMWQPSLREGEPDRLLGRPIIFGEWAKTIGDKGDIILGNWSQYLEGLLQGMQAAESIHVRFVQHERAFRFGMYLGGAPWWKSALTPKNSTATKSPFVVLEAR